VGRTPWPAAEVIVRLCKDAVEQVFRIQRNVFLRSSACPALCLTGCPSNSKTVQERQALEGELKLSQIVIEAREPAVDDDPIWKTSENAPALCNTSSFDHASVDDRAIWDSASSVSFDHDVTVESFVEGRVKSIRATGFRRLQAKTIPLHTPLEIQQEVRHVWLGRFRYAYCQIRWAEGEMWSFKATIEFDDGSAGSLMSDGLHVQLQGRNGQGPA